MSQTYGFLTRTKEDLFGLAKFLMEALDPAFFDDPQNPLTVSVTGATAGGKKIFPDVARDLLLDQEGKKFEGRENFDEYWTGNCKGRAIEVSFINAAYGYGYGREELRGCDKQECLRRFLAGRQMGGLAFVHNLYGFDEVANISIRIETRDDVMGGMHKKLPYAPELIQNEYFRLSNAYHKAAEKDWARYIEVTVNSQKLLASPAFQAQIKRLAPRERGIPVWNVNLPRVVAS